MSWTALACTRNERPTRTAGSSPLCTSRYTVILLTRIRLATSATVRNSARGGCPSPAPPAPASRAAFPLAESRADGPFIDVIATQSIRHGQFQRLPHRWRQPVLTTGRIAWPMGLLRRVWDDPSEIG